MAKYFNVTGLCRPEKHYMVDLSSRLEQMKEMVDNGSNFAITRGFQNGKVFMGRSLKARNYRERVSINQGGQ